MITYEELKKLAALAKLSLDGEDLDALIADVGEMLNFAGMVVNAAAEPEDSDGDMEPCPLRPDTVRPSYPVREILRNARLSQDGYFVAAGSGGYDDE